MELTGSSIQEMFDRFKSLLQDDLFFYTVLIVLIAIASFGLGRASVMQESMKNKPILEIGAQKASGVESQSILSQTSASSTATSDQNTVPATVGTNTYVASKNGTKYHLITCPGAKQIKEENKIYFSTKEEALRAGYTPASNCKGI
jgi:capsule polysaccharide export protein KpsE/RkpR